MKYGPSSRWLTTLPDSSTWDSTGLQCTVVTRSPLHPCTASTCPYDVWAMWGGVSLCRARVVHIRLTVTTMRCLSNIVCAVSADKIQACNQVTLPQGLWFACAVCSNKVQAIGFTEVLGSPVLEMLIQTCNLSMYSILPGTRTAWMVLHTLLSTSLKQAKCTDKLGAVHDEHTRHVIHCCWMAFRPQLTQSVSWHANSR